MLSKSSNNNFESMRENQIVVPDIEKHINDTFDEFCEYQKQIINNEENENVISIAKNDNETLSFIVMKYQIKNKLPVHLDIEKYTKFILKKEIQMKRFIKE